MLQDDDDWNASDYAYHLSRRARGLPLWFSLATYGTDAYTEAVETTLAVAHAGAALIRASDHCELVVEPELSVVVFRRVGWEPDRYARVESTAARRPGVVRRAHVVAWRDGVALLHRQPADDDRRPRGDPRVAAVMPVADLVVTERRCVATLDADRREIAGGWVSVTGGLIDAVGTGTPPPANGRRSMPAIVS